jgi:hypothetical protein
MIWWIIIPAVIVTALAYAHWEHGKVGRQLADLFAPHASANSGSVKAGTLLALPQLRFVREGRAYFVGAMSSGGPLVSGTASRPGINGPFTFANIELPFDTGQTIRIQRSDKLDRGISRTLASITLEPGPVTGDDEFDGMYQIKIGEQEFVERVLDAPLRQVLKRSTQQRLEVALAGAKISVHIDGYATSAAELDEMIDIVTQLADNCASS